MIKKILFTLFFILGMAEAKEPVEAHLTSNHFTVVPGQDFELLLEVTLEPGWHAYWKNPGDSGMAPSIEWKLPEGLEVAHVEWPTPERFELGDAVTFGYSEKAPFVITLHAAPTLTAKTLEIDAELQWVVCSSETCLPGITAVKTHVNVGDKPEAISKEKFIEAKKALPEKLPSAYANHQLGSFSVSFPEEIALNDPPQFFPEEIQDYKKALKILDDKKSIEIPYLGKGVLVLGDKAYAVEPPAKVDPPQEESLNLFWALCFAFVGGLILNLMPCVLPVVSLKVMSFVKMSGDSRAELLKHSLGFTLGVLISFWVLAGALLVLQTTGQAVGWGFQLQNPLFIAALSFLFVLLALNLFGVFEFGTTISGLAGEAEAKSSGPLSSFWSGIFATAVATPCTGPFMGSALGYALTQSPYISFAVFTALGLGMALPYLLIGLFPSLIRWLPKPGAWMESFKQGLGFVMLATVIWLLWVFNGQTSEFGLFLMLFSLLTLSIGAWVYGHFGALHRRKSVRNIGYILTFILLVTSLALANTASNQVSMMEDIAHSMWEPFSAEKVALLREKKQPILIDFTAKWCLICQANHLVMSHPAVVKKFEDYGVVLMKADWTRYDPVITEALKKFGRSGVPLYVLYGEAEEPLILPQVLTPDILISSIENMKQTYVR